MQLFEALTLMAGIYLTDGRPLAEELDRVCAGDYSRNVVFKDGSYIKIIFYGCYYELGTSAKTLVSPNSYVVVRELSNNPRSLEFCKTEAEAFRELCIKVAKIY